MFTDISPSLNLVTIQSESLTPTFSAILAANSWFALPVIILISLPLVFIIILPKNLYIILLDNYVY